MRNRSASELAAEVSLLLHQKLGVKGGGLEARIARAGRRLPRRIRKRAQEIAEAEKLAANPRLARRVDQAEITRAFDEVARHLKQIDVADRRKGALIGVLSSISLALLATFAVTVGLLVWRGYL